MTFAERDKKVLSKLEVDSHYCRVYLYLRDEGTLTTLESISKWNRYNLAQVIARLKKYGANIVDLNVIPADGRYKSKRLLPWARYKLKKDGDGIE